MKTYSCSYCNVVHPLPAVEDFGNGVCKLAPLQPRLHESGLHYCLEHKSYVVPGYQPCGAGLLGSGRFGEVR